MYYTQLTMIDGSVAHKKNILLGACMSQSDCIFGECLAPSSLPRRGEGLGYCQHSHCVGQFAFNNIVSANVNFMGYMRSGDYR